MKTQTLIPHYHHQIARIRAAEQQLLEIVAWLKRSMHSSGFPAAIADLESCCRQRGEWLTSVAGHDLAAGSRRSPARCTFLDTSMFEIFRSDPIRAQALALSLCADLDRQLINAYRVARELAAALGLCSHVRRLDTLMGALGDRNLCWSALPGSSEFPQTVFHSG